MRSIFVSLFTIVVVGLLPQAHAASPANRSDGNEIDRILVVVNNDVITEGEFTSQVNTIKRQLRLARRPVPPDAALRKQVLEKMIMDRIQLQYAERTGIKATAEDVDRALGQIAANNKLTVAQLRQALAHDGIKYEDFRSNIRNQLTIRKLINRDINERVKVSESEVDNFILNAKKNGNVEAEYNVSRIFIGIPEKATADVIAAAKKRAEDLLKKLHDGMDFERAAIEYSQGQEALQGGHLGWKKPGQLPDLFVQALKTMKPGQISGVLRSPNGFHILRLNQVRGDKGQAVTQTHVRHILIRPTAVVSVKDAKLRLEQLRERIVNGESFTALAKAHSDDVASSVDGGDLGWVNPGAMVPEFERAMDKLKPGEVSQPVQTRYGVHLIQVLGRRKADVTKARERAEARRQIHERKAKELYEQWLRQLRDEAYVNYRTDPDNP
jgi:peptidyl-prolyl cis-trans isomerase SurA